MAASCGFAEEDFDQIFIILDKMDKIGMNGVKAELIESGFGGDQVEQYLGLFSGAGADAEGVRRMGQLLSEKSKEAEEACENLAYILDTGT